MIPIFISLNASKNGFIIIPEKINEPSGETRPIKPTMRPHDDGMIE